jgi:hypothetical protein
MAMKTMILILAFIGLNFISVFSQLLNQMKIDTTSKGISLLNKSGSSPLAIDKAYNGFFNNSISERNLLLPNFSKKNILLGQNQNKLTYSVFDKMPCVVPEGNYSMLVSKPDTSIQYYLIIKKPSQ